MVFFVKKEEGEDQIGGFGGNAERGAKRCRRGAKRERDAPATRSSLNTRAGLERHVTALFFFLPLSTRSLNTLKERKRKT